MAQYFIGSGNHKVELTPLQMRRFLTLAGRELSELQRERGLNQTEKELTSIIGGLRAVFAELR